MSRTTMFSGKRAVIQGDEACAAMGEEASAAQPIRAIICWDFDGPLNYTPKYQVDILDISISDEEALHQLEGQETFCGDNRNGSLSAEYWFNLLNYGYAQIAFPRHKKAILDILQNNGVYSLLASQRCLSHMSHSNPLMAKSMCKSLDTWLGPEREYLTTACVEYMQTKVEAGEHCSSSKVPMLEAAHEMYPGLSKDAVILVDDARDKYKESTLTAGYGFVHADVDLSQKCEDEKESEQRYHDLRYLIEVLMKVGLTQDEISDAIKSVNCDQDVKDELSFYNARVHHDIKQEKQNNFLMCKISLLKTKLSPEFSQHLELTVEDISDESGNIDVRKLGNKIKLLGEHSQLADKYLEAPTDQRNHLKRLSSHQDIKSYAEALYSEIEDGHGQWYLVYQTTTTCAFFDSYKCEDEYIGSPLSYIIDIFQERTSKECISTLYFKKMLDKLCCDAEIGIDDEDSTVRKKLTVHCEDVLGLEKMGEVVTELNSTYYHVLTHLKLKKCPEGGCAAMTKASAT